jgi:hypothetical protein
MSLKEELVKLSDECDTCRKTTSDAGHGQVEQCESCHELLKKTHLAKVFYDTFQVIARKPENERFEIMRSRMMTILEMDDEMRFKVITDMLDTIYELSEEDSIKVMNTINTVLVQLSDEQKNLLSYDPN